jgi:hypothetical protein
MDDIAQKNKPSKSANLNEPNLFMSPPSSLSESVMTATVRLQPRVSPAIRYVTVQFILAKNDPETGRVMRLFRKRRPLSTVVTRLRKGCLQFWKSRSGMAD